MHHVYRRRESTNYQYRRFIPPGIRHAFPGKKGKPKRWWIESLKTKDPAEAKRKGAEVDVRVGGMFRLAEAGEWPPISGELIDVWAAHFLRSPVGLAAADAIDDEHLTHADLMALLTKFVTERNIPFRNGSTNFGHLLNEVRISLGRDEPAETRRPVAKTLTMESLIDMWARETQPTEKTDYSWRRIMAKLTNHLRHDDVTRITDADIVSWKESLFDSGLKPSTVKNHLTICSTLFGWSEQSAANPSPREFPANRENYSE
jgi:hypothetical protein